MFIIRDGHYLQKAVKCVQLVGKGVTLVVMMLEMYIFFFTVFFFILEVPFQLNREQDIKYNSPQYRRALQICSLI